MCHNSIVRMLVLTLVAGLSNFAHADPQPELLGDNPPPVTTLESNSPLAGSLAPQTARDWLLAIAPNYGWGERKPMSHATVRSSTRDFVELSFDLELTGGVFSVRLRVFRGKQPLITVTEQGNCCCGSCIAGIHFSNSGAGSWCK